MHNDVIGVRFCFKKAKKEEGLVSNDFTEDFIGECECEYGISISLLISLGMVENVAGLKESHLKELPVGLVAKSALVGDRIVKGLNR